MQQRDIEGDWYASESRVTAGTVLALLDRTGSLDRLIQDAHSSGYFFFATYRLKTPEGQQLSFVGTSPSSLTALTSLSAAATLASASLELGSQTHTHTHTIFHTHFMQATSHSPFIPCRYVPLSAP